LPRTRKEHLDDGSFGILWPAPGGTPWRAPVGYEYGFMDVLRDHGGRVLRVEIPFGGVTAMNAAIGDVIPEDMRPGYAAPEVIIVRQARALFGNLRTLMEHATERLREAEIDVTVEPQYLFETDILTTDGIAYKAALRDIGQAQHDVLSVRSYTPTSYTEVSGLFNTQTVLEIKYTARVPGPGLNCW